MITAPAILIDTTRCTGCERCVAACKSENELAADRPRAGQRRVDDLSATRYSTILQLEGDRYVRQQCRHCLEPACVSACLVGAMQQTPEGPVIYDADRCMGCRYCLLACPFDVPRYEWEAAGPTVRTCTFCYPRLQQGREPACVESCEAEALLFGSRPDVLAEARRRLQAEPGRYQQRIYGEHEVGGTSVLLLSDFPLETLGWANTPDRPLPQLTWAALDKVPATVVAMSALMGGLHWIIGRRMRLAAVAAAAVTAEASPVVGDEQGQVGSPGARVAEHA
jgi:formate dehydrogenase iron-sulfur subunit